MKTGIFFRAGSATGQAVTREDGRLVVTKITRPPVPIPVGQYMPLLNETRRRLLYPEMEK